MQNSVLKIAIVALAVLTASFVRGGVTAGMQATHDRPIDFNRDIRPILSDNCFSCHGPDETKRRARLRFDTRDGVSAKPGLIVAKDPAKSILVQRISATDKDRLMPPVDSGYALTPAQVELIRKWIEQGAVWNEHWAYRAPIQITPPVPARSDASWPRNPIDNFVLARLEREGLHPSVEAEKATLLRRVTLDLTGLPPTPAEVDSFLADQAIDAYERRVDHLLLSPAYGERMAMQWLDLARYADTHGYHIDSQRDMWPWRDWVIGAFNRNLRFDRFTIEQLAGDLLPNATLEQRIASGFNRNHMINFEGGAIPEEYQTEYVVDRVETVSTTWLGTTMGCARCHTHKYDPITQREFYQFFAFFNNVGEEGLDGSRGNAKPMLPLPSEKQKDRLEELNQQIKSAEGDLADAVVAPLETAWSKPLVGRIASAPREGLIAHYELDGNFSDLSGHLQHGRGVSGDPNFVTGAIGRGASFDGDTQVTFRNVGDFERDQKFTISFWARGGKSQPMTILQKIDAANGRGYEFGFDDRELIAIQRFAQRLNFKLTAGTSDNAIRFRTTKAFPMGEWLQISLTSDGSSRAEGLRLFVNGEKQSVEVLQDSLNASVRSPAELQVGKFAKSFNGGIDDLRIYSRALEPREIEQLAITYPVEVILSGLLGKRTKEEDARLREHFLTYAAPENVRKRSLELKALKSEREQLNKEIVTVMVMDEREKPRETFILGRGDYRNRTEKVTADVPAVLPPLPAGASRDRLALAKWLVDGKHPLTARVAINRFWQTYFGLGIVKTAEDFGSQGDPPVHPELLDWLAVEFVKSGWDTRAMQRLIVTSATYRQSSRVTPQLLEKDPENRLLARGPRHRLQAEMIRDNALAVSGLLNAEIGGPSVFPYQSPGLWEELAFGDGFSAQEYRLSTGKDLYRRSLYTFWKRTVPPASMSTFDAPDREKCTARRPVTNTPLQALIGLNDPTFVEAARVLATRALREGGRDTSSRLQYAFRLVVARRPSRPEQQVLLALLNAELARYRQDRAAAAKLLTVGKSTPDSAMDGAELAAWTIVASAMLNLDEAITNE
ncbi:MAG: DUF1553 domain-containing protein [Acidobacteriota bacterium]